MRLTIRSVNYYCQNSEVVENSKRNELTARQCPINGGVLNKVI